MSNHIFSYHLLHRFFITLIPWLFFCSIFSCIGSLSSNFPQIPIMFYVLTFFGSLYRMILHDILKQEKATRYLMRAYIISFVLFYFFAQLLTHSYIHSWWKPTIKTSILLFILVLIWLVAHKMQENFILYEKFMNMIEGFNGLKLYKKIKGNNVLISEASQGIKYIQFQLTSIYIGMFLVLLTRQIKYFSIPVSLSFLVIAIFLLTLLCQVDVIVTKKVLYCSTLGLTIGFDVQKKQRLYVNVFLSILAVLLFCFTSDTPIFHDSENKSLLLILWKIIVDFFSRFFAPTAGQQQIDTTLSLVPIKEAFDYSKTLPQGVKSSFNIIPLITILKYSIIVLIVIAVLYFIFYPLFKKGWFAFWHEKHLYQYIMLFFHNLKVFFHNFRYHSHIESYSKVSVIKQQNAFMQKMGGLSKRNKKAHKKQREIGLLTKYFLRLIDFGNSHECVFVSSLSPLEYTTALAHVLQSSTFMRSELDQVGQLFEKALYSNQLLTKHEIRQYVDKIKNVYSSAVEYS